MLIDVEIGEQKPNLFHPCFGTVICIDDMFFFKKTQGESLRVFFWPVPQKN
jgi:hypothetical protein